MTSWARMCLGNHEGRAQANATVAGRAKAVCTRVYNEYRNIDLAPHGGNINEHMSTGNLQMAPVSSNLMPMVRLMCAPPLATAR